MMKSYVDLHVWQVAMDLMDEIYRLTEKFPPEERFELTKQIRRAALSIIGNIAEGFGRYTYKDKANKYVISRGECLEVAAFLLASVRLKIVTNEDVANATALAERTGQMLNGLIRSCRKRE